MFRIVPRLIIGNQKMIYPKVDDILLSSNFFHEIRHYKLLEEGNFTQGYRIHEQGQQIGRIYGDCWQLFWLATQSVDWQQCEERGDCKKTNILELG